jgi:hypothetical protein
MELDLRHHPSHGLPTRGLIEKTLEPNHRLVTRPSHRPRQQLGNVPLQIVVRRKAGRVLHLPLFQHLVQVRLGKGRIGAEDYLPAQPLLAFNLRQQQSSQPSAQWTLPGRSLAARQSPSRLNSGSGL